MSYDFERYNYEELQMKQEDWNLNALEEGLKSSKDKLTLKSLEITNITKGMFLRNWEILQNMKSLYWISEEQEFLDAGIDKEFLAWAEYHNIIARWYKCQKFYVNKNTLKSIIGFLEMFTEFDKKLEK